MARKKKKKRGFQKGHKPWNKGKKIGANSFNKFASSYMKQAAETWRSKEGIKKAVKTIKKKAKRKKR